MADFLAHLKQRKLVQWAIAYVAGAWAVLQVLQLVGGEFGWPGIVMRIITVVLGVGFFVALVLAWYHGERGAQRVGGIELVMLAALLVIAAVAVTWVRHQYGRAGPPVAGTHAPAAGGKAAPKMVAAATASAPPSIATPPPLTTQSIPAKSIAVLPFQNLSADKNNAYFADGIQDLILTKLADIGDLKVISRTSTLQYGSHPGNLKQIGEQLGVATILEGSVQKAGNQVLINVQLIDAKTDGHIWAQSYTRTLDNIFGVEGEVAQKVADALKAKLTAAESAQVTNVPTTNATAYDAYLRGEHFLGQAGIVTDFQLLLPKAVAAYRQAVTADPEFALAWARLAFSQSLLIYDDIDTSDATRREALANAKRALALSPNLSQAHYALGYVYRIGFAEYDKALAEYRLAEQAAPNSAPVVAAIAFIEGIRGNNQAMAASLQRALVLDPRNANIAANLGSAFQGLGRWDAARDAMQRVEALAPDDSDVYVLPAQSDVLQHGDVAAALAQLERAPQALQADPHIVSERVLLLQFKRDYQAAQKSAVSLHGDRYILLRADTSALAGHAGEARELYAQVLSRLPVPPVRLTAVWLERRRYDLFDRAEAQAALGHVAIAHDGLRRFIAFAQRAGCVDGVTYANYVLARVDARSGDASDATGILRRLLDTEGNAQLVSLPLLKLDPVWDPIRHDPRFQALLKQYDNAQPAAASSGVSP